MVAIKWEAALAAATPPPLRPAAVLTSHTCSLLLPQGPPHPDLYGIPPPLPRRLQQPCWQRWWWRWRRAWAPSPPPPPLPPFPPLPPLRNQGLVGVTYSDAQSGVFLGSPSIARLDADTLLISHVSHLMRLLPCENEFAHRMACTERSCHDTRHFDTAEMPAASPANAALIQLVDLIQTRRPARTSFLSGAAPSAPPSTPPKTAVRGTAAPLCRASFGPRSSCTKAGSGGKVAVARLLCHRRAPY